MVSTPAISGRFDTIFAQRLALRVSELNEIGEQDSELSTQQFSIEGVIGTPEGRAIGSPGDIRVRLDVPQLWQKVTGERTTTGWQMFLGGSDVVGVCECNEITAEDDLLLRTGDGNTVIFQTQTQLFAAPRFGSFWIEDLTVPVGTTVLAPILTMTQDFRTAMINLSAHWIDSVTPGAAASFGQISAWYRSAGVTAPIVAQLFDKQFAGGAATFAADVTVAASISAANQISLLAANGGAAPRTGHIAAFWTIQEGGEA